MSVSKSVSQSVTCLGVEHVRIKFPRQRRLPEPAALAGHNSHAQEVFVILQKKFMESHPLYAGVSLQNSTERKRHVHVVCPPSTSLQPASVGIGSSSSDPCPTESSLLQLVLLYMLCHQLHRLLKAAGHLFEKMASVDMVPRSTVFLSNRDSRPAAVIAAAVVSYELRAEECQVLADGIVYASVVRFHRRDGIHIHVLQILGRYDQVLRRYEWDIHSGRGRQGRTRSCWLGWVQFPRLLGRRGEEVVQMRHDEELGAGRKEAVLLLWGIVGRRWYWVLWCCLWRRAERYFEGLCNRHFDRLVLAKSILG